MRAIQLASRFTFSLCTLVAVLVASGGSSRADMLVSSTNSGEILRYDQTTGAYLGVFASGNGLSHPWDLTFGPNGNLYVATARDIYQFDGHSGAFITKFSEVGGAGVTFGPDGDIYVADGPIVRHLDGTSGAFISNFASGISGGDDLIFGPDGNLYVASQNSNQVLKFNGTTGASQGVFTLGGTISATTGLAFGPDGHLYVGSYSTDQILRYNGMTGQYMNIFASGSGFGSPELGLAFGPDGNLYASSEGAGKVFCFNGTTGAFMNVFAVAPSGFEQQRLTGLVFTPTQAVPEPTSMALLGLASLGGLGLRLRQRRRVKAAA